MLMTNSNPATASDTEIRRVKANTSSAVVNVATTRHDGGKALWPGFSSLKARGVVVGGSHCTATTKPLPAAVAMPSKPDAEDGHHSGARIQSHDLGYFS